jgi:hypothetical protein
MNSSAWIPDLHYHKSADQGKLHQSTILRNQAIVLSYDTLRKDFLTFIRSQLVPISDVDVPPLSLTELNNLSDSAEQDAFDMGPSQCMRVLSVYMSEMLSWHLLNMVHTQLKIGDEDDTDVGIMTWHYPTIRILDDEDDMDGCDDLVTTAKMNDLLTMQSVVSLLTYTLLCPQNDGLTYSQRTQDIVDTSIELLTNSGSALKSHALLSESTSSRQIASDSTSRLKKLYEIINQSPELKIWLKTVNEAELLFMVPIPSYTSTEGDAKDSLKLQLVLLSMLFIQDGSSTERVFEINVWKSVTNSKRLMIMVLSRIMSVVIVQHTHACLFFISWLFLFLVCDRT